ncbi:MAG: diguanylate cyclase domain-containing protein [Methylophagaceae bacterium]
MMMPYSLFKKVGLFLCFFLCSSFLSVAHAQTTFLGQESSSILAVYSRTDILWLSLYAGALLALLGYNFLLFVTLRTISYLYYTLLVGAILLAYGAFNGLWFSTLWPNSLQWHELSLPIGLILAGLFSIQFSRSFLTTSSRSPKLDKFFLRLTLVFGLVFIATPFAPLIHISFTTTLLIIILCFSMLIASIKTCLQGNRASQIHMMAWFILLLGISFSLAHQFGWSSNQWLSHYALSLSTLCFVLLLSLALAYRIIITRSQTAKFHQQVIANSNTKVAEQVKEQTIELTELNEQLRQQEGVLKKLAFYDGLTGLANRAFIQEQLKQLLIQSRRNKTKVSVLFLDLDDFKPINDEHGHKVGDEVLTTIAERLKATLRESDTVGRLGCDKFLVLLESSREDKHDPAEVADKIRAAVALPISMDWFILHIGTSVGIARYPNDGSDAKSLVVAADAAMRLDKENKKTRHQ